MLKIYEVDTKWHFCSMQPKSVTNPIESRPDHNERCQHEIYPLVHIPFIDIYSFLFYPAPDILIYPNPYPEKPEKTNYIEL